MKEQASFLNVKEHLENKGFKIHIAFQDSTGRLEFYDMEDKEIKKTVDLRTVTEVIVKNVKYIL